MTVTILTFDATCFQATGISICNRVIYSCKKKSRGHILTLSHNNEQLLTGHLRGRRQLVLGVLGVISRFHENLYSTLGPNCVSDSRL